MDDMYASDLQDKYAGYPPPDMVIEELKNTYEDSYEEDQETLNKVYEELFNMLEQGR